MTKKKEEECDTENGVQKYELRPPDGGWGYVIVLATIIMFLCTNVPMFSFGLIFGDFLQTIGDATAATTLSTGLFETVYSFTGLIANGVLNRFSYRKVGIAGSIIFFIGACGVVFFQNLFQLIILFAVVQGLGFGLMMPAAYSAMNDYFVDKLAVMMGITQAVIIASCVVVPQVANWSMETFGFRGTLVGLAGLSLSCLPVMVLMQPVKKHMRKVPVPDSPNTTVLPEENKPSKSSLPAEVLKSQIQPLLNQEKHFTSQRSLNRITVDPQPRRSVISLGDRIGSVTALNDFKEKQKNKQGEEVSMWQSIIKSMDMSLLKEPRYLNISFGLALCFSSDTALISILPLVLGNIGFSTKQVALIMTVYFSSDLTARILLTIISGIVKLRNRMLVFFAALLSAILRIVLVTNDTYMFKMIVLGMLGFLRCFIHTPLPLVIVEEYSDRFSTAFSLFLAVNGVVSLVFGVLMSSIKTYTGNDVMVCQTLTVGFSICVISWTVEMTLCRKKHESENI